jgi:immunoglobulin-binding protein 1
MLMAQELVCSVRNDLREVMDRISTLSLFSLNESVDDISTRDLVYLFAPYVAAEAEGRIKTSEPEDRIERIRFTQVSFILKFCLFVANLM